MATRTWRIWRDGNIDKFLSTCKFDDDLVLLLPQEHEIIDGYAYSTRLKPYKSVLIVIGTYNIKHLDPKSLPTNIKVIMCPLFFAFFVMAELHPSQMQQLPKFSKKIKQHFLTLNGAPHHHRAIVLDHLSKYKLLTKSNHSWHGNNEAPIKTKYWNQEKNFLDGKGYSADILPRHAHISLLYIANESTPRNAFITEKTFRVMRHKVPVIAFGYTGINSKLEEFGFKIPKDYFDMSFDSIKDLDEKSEAFAKSMAEFCKIPIKDLINPFKNIAEHNFQKLIDITSDPSKHIPDILLYDKFEKFYFEDAKRLSNHLTQLSSKN